nr:reverse transcriptase domain-containing protein [Tanacetum cinerariifolium]
MMKFPTLKGVAMLVTQTFIIAECRRLEKRQMIKEESLEEKGEVAVTEKVLVNPSFSDQLVTIGRGLSEACKDQLKCLLKDNMEVFMWEPSDMTRVPQKIIEHALNVNLSLDPVCQKRRTFSIEKGRVVTNKVAEWVKAGIVHPVKYPTYISNPVMIKKGDGTWRMCIDFKNLNSACLKDYYPLPNIDCKVELVTGFKYKCFLDAYNGYHQIQMAEEDEEKTAFYTDQKRSNSASFKTRLRFVSRRYCVLPKKNSCVLLQEDIQCAGSNTRPPMLDRTDFVSWQQRIRLYCRGKDNGVNILKSIDEGPYKLETFRETLAKSTKGTPQFGSKRPRVYSDLMSKEKDQYNADNRATNILLQGLPKDIYTLINHYTDAKEIWDNVKMLLEGSKLTKEDRESQLYDDFEHFRQHKEESIHDYYVRFAKLINDMRNIKMTMSKLQLNSKFVNNMLPEWEPFSLKPTINSEHLPIQGTKPQYKTAEWWFRMYRGDPIEAEDCDAFDLDVDEAPTAQTIGYNDLISMQPRSNVRLSAFFLDKEEKSSVPPHSFSSMILQKIMWNSHTMADMTAPTGQAPTMAPP